MNSVMMNDLESFLNKGTERPQDKQEPQEIEQAIEPYGDGDEADELISVRESQVQQPEEEQIFAQPAIQQPVTKPIQSKSLLKKRVSFINDSEDNEIPQKVIKTGKSCLKRIQKMAQPKPHMPYRGLDELMQFFQPQIVFSNPELIMQFGQPMANEECNAIMSRIIRVSHHLYLKQNRLREWGLENLPYRDAQLQPGCKRWVNTNLNQNEIIGHMDESMFPIEEQQSIKQILDLRLSQIPELQIHPINNRSYYKYGCVTYMEDPQYFLRNLRARNLIKILQVLLGNMAEPTLFRIIQMEQISADFDFHQAQIYYPYQYYSNSYEGGEKPPSITQVKKHMEYFYMRLKYFFNQQRLGYMALMECLLCGHIVDVEIKHLQRDLNCMIDHSAEETRECTYCLSKCMPWLCHLSQHMVVMDYTYRYHTNLLTGFIQRKGTCLICNTSLQGNPVKQATVSNHFTKHCLFSALNTTCGPLNINSFYGPFFITTFQQLLKIDSMPNEEVNAYLSRQRVEPSVKLRLVSLNESESKKGLGSSGFKIEDFRIRELKVLFGVKVRKDDVFEKAYVSGRDRAGEIIEELKKIVQGNKIIDIQGNKNEQSIQEKEEVDIFC
ncbi:hypothetical protein FGO68_gene3922 [Halteria grandinella]|uniref:Uncharacterized protein n=1 Tax=Halteria grandinella TaxID=5974 RepID=A0A8J8P5J6_HALGN|nr:hypothetical protein FGO68_gene3922 [Halteria grandinella]